MSQRRIQPVRLCKRTDGTTPLLYKGLTQNQRLDGDIKLFDPRQRDDPRPER